MNKPLLLLTAALFAIPPVTMFAQAALPPPGAANRAASAQSPDLKHFNLDFAGGTPGELAAAVSKATQKHLNMIIPTSHADTKIMSIKVEGVTVPQLFEAIQTASKREEPMVTGRSGPGGQRGQGGQKTIQFRNVGLMFQTASNPVTDESIWSFTSTAPTAADDAVLSSSDEPEQVCQYFQLGPYLQDHTIEDITTAIQTGWKMLKVDPMPQLSFHEETKLLIAVGAAQQVAQIPEVLKQLPLDNSAAVEKIAKLQAELDDIEGKKDVGWEPKATELHVKIKNLALAQRARETIQNTPTKPEAAAHPPIMNESTATGILLMAAETDARPAEADMEDRAVAMLTARLIAGEEAAWREFHAQYFDRLLRYLLVVCRGDEDAARESLQAALVKIVRHVRRFDREEALWGWLTVVARSCVIDGARRQSRYRALLERYAGIFTTLPVSAATEPLPELLDDCLDALPSAERELLAAKYRDGQSTAVLASESGCSEKAMESRLARLRQRVKAHLMQRLRDEN